MDWLSAHWWQVALVVIGWLVLRELRQITHNTVQIFNAIWSFPEMRAQADHARFLRQEAEREVTARSASMGPSAP